MLRTDPGSGHRRTARGRTAARRIAALAAVVLIGACRQDMHDQPKLEAFESSPVFADSMGSRLPVAGTVARGYLEEDDHLYRGTANGEGVTTFPFAVTDSLMQRGRNRYDIYCAPCHGRAGDAKGMVIPYGFTEPPSMVDGSFSGYTVGSLFDIITNGSGDMPAYADQISPRDRWAIIAYTRALALSQHADTATLAQQDRDALARIP